MVITDMKNIVNVVVPIYNVEKYLERCIDSLVNQTYKNIEIILVDDASPDNCPGICEKYADQYDNITVIHHEINKGLSAARNTGIESSNGQWITFVDSDDYVSPHYVEELLKLCLESDCECSICRYISTTNDKCDFRLSGKYIIMSGYEAVVGQFGEDSDILTIACGKMYLRSLFNDVRFPVGKINEDVFTTHKVLYKSSKVIISNSILYAYYKSSTGIMRGKFTLKRLDILDAYKNRIQYYEELGEKDIVNITKRAYCNRLYDAYWICKRYLPEEKDVIKDIRSNSIKIYNSIKKVKKYPDFNFKKNLLMKIKLRVGRLTPRIYNYIFVINKNYI